MKVCYVDESGNQEHDPCLVMVGLIIDTARLNRTREEFKEVFSIVQGLFDEDLKELKASKIISGGGRWRNVSPDIRKKIAEFFCGWIVDRKHNIALAAIDRSQFARMKESQANQPNFDPWLGTSLHIALQLQKHHQMQKKNKGRTYLFVDENKRYADRLAELLFDPPEWTDTYYNRGKKQTRLDQLIDSAFAVKSHHAGIVQVADLFAYILRRFAELRDYGSEEAWEGERTLIEGYAKILASRLIPRATRWPARPKSLCAQWYNKISPPSLLALGE